MSDTHDEMSQVALHQALMHVSFVEYTFVALISDIAAHEHDSRISEITEQLNSAKNMITDMLYKSGFYEFRDGESEADWLRRTGPPLPPTSEHGDHDDPR